MQLAGIIEEPGYKNYSMKAVLEEDIELCSISTKERRTIVFNALG